jgi:hypothetical protein
VTDRVDVVSRALRCVIATAGALGIVLAAAPDARASTTARLVYLRGAGTETCPNEVELHDAVAARLGYDPFTPFALETLFTEVDKDGTGFVARVKLVAHDNSVRGARTLKTTGPCTDLMASLALTISIAIDPMAGSRKGPPEGLPPRERDVEIGPSEPRTDGPGEDKPPPPVPDPVEPSPRIYFAVGAGTIGGVAYAPGPSVGFLAFGRARRGDLSLAVEARADLPSGADVSDPGGRVRSSLVAFSLLPCGHVSVLFGCARGSLGRLSAESLDVTDPGETSSLWAAVGLRAGAEVPLGRIFAVRLHLDGDAIVTRYALRISGATSFRYPSAAGGIGLGVAATFP